MKKLTTFLLALLLCCSVFVACTTDTNRPESTPIDSSSIATEDSSTPDSSIVEESALDSAVKYVRALYIMDSATTASDYYVIAQAPVGDQTFDIEWSVDVTEGVAVVTKSDKEGMVLIDVTRGATDVNYVLTATLTDGTDTKSVSFNRVVPFATVNTYAEYAASENGDALTVRGIVIGWEDKARGDSANSIFLHDLNNEGGYYLYNLSELPAGLAVGVTIEASGEFELYNGTYELKNVSATIIDSTANPVAPIDYTDAFINAADTKAAELVSRQAMLVTLKGVTITDQDAANGYLNFTLGGKTAYLRISGSHNCITKDEQAAMKALHAASYGSTADVTGYVAIYSGAFYLVPVDANAIANVTVPERNDAEKVELEKGALSVTSSVSSDTTLTLPVAGTTYEEVAISWASNSDYAVVDGGNVAITVPDEKTTVTLTATLTLNDATDTASFEVVLNKMPTAIAELNALGAAQESYTTSKYIAEGVITKLIISGAYGNLYIKDNNGDELYIYGLYIDGDKYGDYTGSKPVEGDYVRVIGVVGQYKGTPQMKNADLMTFATPHNVASALALTEGKAYVVATVKEVYNTKYGNMYLTDDGTNSFTVYGSYDVFGNRYDALAVKPEAGDTIGVYGDISVFNNAAQIKNGVIFYWVKGEVAPSVCPGCNVEGEEHAKCETCGEYTCNGEDHTACTAPEVIDTIAGALAAEDGLAVEITGTVIKVDYNWSSSNNNMSVTISDGTDQLYIYKLATKVELYDIITVTGVVGSYNGAKQIAAGATATIDGKHEHTFENGTCTLCGAAEVVETVTTIAGALAADDGAPVVITGIVVEINYNWSSSSNNMSVTITDGTDKLYIYKLATEVAFNDIITVTGVVGSYNNAKQIAAGATATIDGQHTEHTYANGLCTACGATQPIDATLATLAYTADTTTNMTDGNNAATVGLDASIFTVTSDKGNQSNHVGLNKNHDFRLYAGNCALTVSVADGYSIVKIKLNFASSNASAEFTVNGVTYTPDASLVDINANSFVIVNTAASGQLRFSSIEIYYVGGSAPAVTCPGCGVEGEEHALCEVCGSYTCDGKDHTHAPAVTCPGCGVEGEEHALCEVCSKYVCVGDHSACTQTPAEPTTVTISIESLAAAKGWANGVQYSTFELDSVISASASTGGNNGKYYTSGQNYRLYQGDSGTFTLTAKTGYTIVSVKITYASQNTGCLTLNGSNVTSATLVNVNANSITFGVGNTGSATNGQARITSIEVIYQAA